MFFLLLFFDDHIFFQIMLSAVWKDGFSSIQSLSHVWLFATPWIAARQAFLSITNSWSLLKLMSIESVMPSNHLILCRPLLLLPSIFPSLGLFQWVSSSHQVARLLEFQLQHQSFRWIFRTGFLQDGLVGSLCRPRDSQESSTTPQFRGINSSVLSLLYGSTLTSIHDYWKDGLERRKMEMGDWLEDFTTSWVNEEGYLNKCTNNGVEEKWVCSGNS